MKSLIISLLLIANVFSVDIVRHGVTWTITGTPTNGTYANGDPWVVGPISITAISPTPSAGRNGTVVNPSRGSTQGFDDRVQETYSPYSETLNVGNDLPLAVSASSSVVSSISTVATVSFEQIDTYAILTVLSGSPATNSFRPAYIGGDYTHPWAKGDLDYTKLADMDSTLISVPAIATSEADFDKVWYEQSLSWTGRYLHTDYMGGGNGYGRNMAIDTGTAALQLNLDYSDAEKETLLISLVQYGIDIHGIIQDGGAWNADGGHNPGRLAPLFIAAMTFNDADMKANLDASTSKKFQEYQQTFYVAQSDIDLTHSGVKPPYTDYTQNELGMPEWGIRHSSSPTTDNKQWDAAYRDISGGVAQAPAIVIYLMNGGSVINWPALSDYAERHIYYRQGRYADPVYYNGYDDGDDYSDGDTNWTTPFAYNETPSFHSNFYLEFENADPVGSTPDATAPVISDITEYKTDTTATIEWTTDEGANSNVDYGTTTGYGTTVSESGLRTAHSLEITGLTASTEYNYQIRSSDAVPNERTSANGTFTTNAAATVTVTPAFSPSSGNYWASQTVTVTASPSDSIEYTTDGTDPDGDDTTYSSPFSVSNSAASTRLKAVATKASQTDSLVGISDYIFSPWQAVAGIWINVVYPTETTAFTETIYASVSDTESTDLVVGLGVSADAYNDLAIMWRFSVTGVIEARNGADYEALNTLDWIQGEVYQFDVSDVVFGTSYDLTVTSHDGVATVIADDYAWRTDWTGSATINSVGLYDSTGPGGLVSTENDINQLPPASPVKRVPATTIGLLQ